MRKLGRLLIFILALCLSLGTLAACGPDEENNGPTTYTATVVDEGGSGIADAIIKFKVGSSVKEKRTNIAGVATIEVAADDLGKTITAEVTEVPAGYSLPEGGAVQYGSGQTSLSFTVGSVVSYTVNVISDGGAVEGARIRLFVGGVEVDTLFSDMYGKAEFNIPSPTGEVTAKILGAPDGYVKPEADTLTFGADRTVTFEVLERVSYTVKTQDVFHRAVLGVTVSVYKTDGTLVDKKTVSSQNGVVFTLDKIEYYLVVEVINPSFKCSQGEDVGGGRRVSIDAGRTNSHTLEFVQIEDNIEYSVTVKNSDGTTVVGAPVNLYSLTHELLGTAVSNADGVVSFSVPNGSYIAAAMPTDMTTSAEPLYFTKDLAVVGEITLKNQRAGADVGTAVMLLDNEYNRIYVPKGEISWCYVPNGINRTVVIVGAEGITVRYNGNEYTDIGGIIMVALESSGEALLEIENGGSADKTLSLAVNKKGTAGNPIELELNTNINIVLANGETVYYTFTADEDKTLSFAFSGSHSELAALYFADKRVEKIVLKQGQTIVFALAAHDYEGGSVSYTVKAAFEERYIDYTVNVQKENANSLAGIMVQLYRDGVAVPNMLLQTNESGVVVFENILEYSDYTAGIVGLSAEYVASENVSFIDNMAGISITLKPVGTLESPYDIIIGETASYVNIQSSVTWFEINIRGVSEYLLEFIAPNGFIEIYDAKDGEVLVTVEADGDGGITYVFNDSTASEPLDEGVYYIKLSIPGSSMTVTATLAGYTPELPLKIGEAGEYVATVEEDGSSVYYSYVGALSVGDSLTVSVDSTARLTVGGELISGGEYTFTYDGTAILFEISADTAENYDFTITVE